MDSPEPHRAHFVEDLAGRNGALSMERESTRA
jgi:hypothetical protein